MFPIANKYTNDELWNVIAEDFEFARNNLPERQEQVGRANSLAATAYLAKLRLFQAYEQDENHRVTSVNTSRLQEVVDLARPLINQIRERAANSTGRTQLPDGSDPSNYQISQYDGSNWTQDYARHALRFERRLEFAMEGDRFFDLVRWGIAEEVLNEYLENEKPRRSFLNDALFTAGRDEYYPIPQREIDFTKGLY